MEKRESITISQPSLTVPRPLTQGSEEDQLLMLHLDIYQELFKLGVPGNMGEKRKRCIKHPLRKGSWSGNWFLWVFLCMETYIPYFISFTHMRYILIFIVACNCNPSGFICTGKNSKYPFFLSLDDFLSGMLFSEQGLRNEAVKISG